MVKAGVMKVHGSGGEGGGDAFDGCLFGPEFADVGGEFLGGGEA